MDLTSGIVGMKQAEVMGQIQMSVAKKMLDMQKMEGASAVQLIEAAANAGQSAGDSVVAAATGLGGQLDTYA
jgi:hypothetical protein